MQSLRFSPATECCAKPLQAWNVQTYATRGLLASRGKETTRYLAAVGAPVNFLVCPLLWHAAACKSWVRVLLARPAAAKALQQSAGRSDSNFVNQNVSDTHNCSKRQGPKHRHILPASICLQTLSHLLRYPAPFRALVTHDPVMRGGDGLHLWSPASACSHHWHCNFNFLLLHCSESSTSGHNAPRTSPPAVLHLVHLADLA